MILQFSDRIVSGIGEFYTLTLLALSGMMFAASSNDLIMVFVSLELITVSFYILVSFQRSRMGSLEAGVKYLILGALSSAFLIFGIALVHGSADIHHPFVLCLLSGVGDHYDSVVCIDAGDI